MKYYKTEYLEMANSKSEETRLLGDKMWDKAYEEYHRYFQTIKNKIPRKFLKLYYENYGFHDAPIQEISIQNIGRQLSEITFIIELDNKLYQIKYKKVQYYSFTVPSNKSWIGNSSKYGFGVMSWGYDEFEAEGNVLTHRILCDHNCEFEITCRNIAVEMIKKQRD